MMLNLTSTQRSAVLCLLFSSGIFILWGSFLTSGPYGMFDFKGVYYGARCLIDHSDPYQPNEFLSEYLAQGGKLPSNAFDLQSYRSGLFRCINLPSSLFLVAPLAMLPWGLASVLWMMLIAGSFTLAAFLMWNAAESYAPKLAPLLVCFVLANTEILLELGNTAGIAVGLCIVAVWCFLEERFVPAGILCLAVSLAMKPHDAGLVWLYFLLAGGAHRRRALQTLLVLAALVLPSILWVSHVAPQWAQELHANLAASAAHGSLNDPGPASNHFRVPDMVISLQSAIAIFRDDPRIYNAATYLVCGALLLLGAVRTLRSRFSQANAWLALAAIAALSMLPVYHRLHDAKLLLLTVPACAMVWAGGGTLKWPAGLLTSAAIVVTGDLPSTFLVVAEKSVNGHVTGLAGRVLELALLRPAAPILLATGVFYLWVYLRRTASDRGLKGAGGLTEKAKRGTDRAASLADA